MGGATTGYPVDNGIPNSQVSERNVGELRLPSGFRLCID
jgi:hypothetical protein